MVALVLVASSSAAKFAAKTCTAKNKVKTCVFSYTGQPVKWVVPTGVTGVTVTVYGAQGAASAQNGTGGLGGEATAYLAVKAGSALQVDVGGAGSGSTGGWNGGGSAGSFISGVSSGGGGGASDVRAGKCVAKLTCTMSQALLVAGGGGGGGQRLDPSDTTGAGGLGGGFSGGDTASGGGGGTQTAGGTAGAGWCSGGGGGYYGGGGGGATSFFPSCDAGGGGGGGYYGGGGGGSGQAGAEAAAGAGGGGSGYGPLHSLRVAFASGVRVGSGSISIRYPAAKTAPTIASGASAQFPTGKTSSFTVTTGATWPIPKLKVVGSLPVGVTFVDKHNGIAMLAGKPSASVAGAYKLQIVASNGVGPNAVQKFTLTVGAAPQITSTKGPSFGFITPPATTPQQTFTITTGGDPTPTTITETGTLPSGLTFKDNGNGTATISGAPNENNGQVIGAWPITLKASRPGGGSWPAATQQATVYVDMDHPQYRAFTLNATGTDSTPLNPGFGLAVNGTPCYTYLAGTTYVDCGPGSSADSYFEAVSIGGRGCDDVGLPLATSASVADCYDYYLSWDPVDNVTISAPLTTTVGAQTYDFLYWDLSGQSVASCNGGNNTNPDCTFLVPKSGTNVNAVYTPAPLG